MLNFLEGSCLCNPMSMNLSYSLCHARTGKHVTGCLFLAASLQSPASLLSGSGSVNVRMKLLS